jgi:hypothetical protein
VSSSNVPPNTPPPSPYDPFRDAEAQARLGRDQVAAAAKLNLSLTQATRQLKASAAAFINPVNRLRDSLSRLDETNRRTLQIGTTSEKLTKEINKNSNVLTKGLVSNQKVIDAIATNYESGVRVQTTEMMNLTAEMIATGQDVQGLTNLNSDLLLFTGNNINALESVNKVNREVSDKYGVSNQKLIESVNSLRDTFEEASFYGADTTASLMNLTNELKVRTGGKNVEGAIKTLFSLGTGGLDTLSASMRTGAQGFRAKIGAGGQVGMEDIQPILDRVASIASQAGGGNLAIGADIAASITGLSRQQVNQLLQLNQQLQSDYTLNESMKKTQDETYNNLKNINERALNFYDKTAVDMLGILGKIDTTLLMVIAQGAMGAGAAFGFLGGFGKSAKAGASTPTQGQIRMGQVGKTIGVGALGLGAYAAGSVEGSTGKLLQAGLGGAAMGAAFGGPVGALVGGTVGVGVSLLQGILDTNEKQEDMQREQVEAEREERNRRRAAAMSDQLRSAQYLIGYLRSRGMTQSEDATDVLRELLAEQRRANNRADSASRTDAPE